MNENVQQLVQQHQPQIADIKRARGVPLKTIAYYENEQFATTLCYPDYLIGDHGTIYDMRTQKKVNLHTDRDGYKTVYARNDHGSSGTVSVQRMMMTAHNPISDHQKMQVSHLDGVRWNNIYHPNMPDNNLVWTTKQDTTKKMLMNRQVANGSNVATSKFTEDQAVQTCEWLSRGAEWKYIAHALGLPYTEQVRGFIRSIKSRRAWKHISDQYEW